MSRADLVPKKDLVSEKNLLFSMRLLAYESFSAPGPCRQSRNNNMALITTRATVVFRVMVRKTSVISTSQ